MTTVTKNHPAPTGINYKKASLWCNSFLCLVFMSSALALSAPSGAPVNEIFTYTMKFNGKSTANSTLQFTHSDSTRLEICWLLKSKTIFKLLFSVDNRYHSFVNTETGLPAKVFKNIKQKNITQAWQTSYNREQSVAVTDNGLQWPVQNDCLDILSLIWTLRHGHLTPGDSLAYLIDIESHVWRLEGIVTAAESGHNSRQVTCNCQVEFSFSPALPIVKRTWKTDLLTNRISRADTRLTICFGPPPANVPVYLKFINSENTVEMLLDKLSPQK